MLGKQKCRILKEIRQRIADENDIPYITRECTFQGACKGTCPKCEAELRYLEQQLALRESMGKRVAVAALCMGVSLTAAGCGPAAEKKSEPGGEEVYQTEGEVAYDDTTESQTDPTQDGTETPDGTESPDGTEASDGTETPDEIELSGDIEMPDETGTPDGTDQQQGEMVTLSGEVAYPEDLGEPANDIEDTSSETDIVPILDDTLSGYVEYSEFAEEPVK